MSKKQKIEYCRHVLKTTINGGEVSDLGRMAEILSDHPEWESKIGSGLRSIVKRETPYRNNYCFHIVRTDGTETDISFMKAINGINERAIVIKAMRNAALPSIIEYKQQNYTPNVSRCAISGELLNDNNVHVDHYDLYFADLAKIYIDQYGLEHIKNDVLDHGEKEYITRFTVERASDFRRFHDANTNLRLLTKRVNMSRRY